MDKINISGLPIEGRKELERTPPINQDQFVDAKKMVNGNQDRALEAWQRVNMHIQEAGGFRGWAQSTNDMDTIKAALQQPAPMGVDELKRKIKREKNCDIEISCSDVNGVVNLLVDYLAKNNHLKLPQIAEPDGVVYGFVGRDKSFYSMDEEIREALDKGHLRTETGWKTIDSAPKDGTHFWAWLNHKGIVKMFYQTAEQYCEAMELRGRYDCNPSDYNAGFVMVDDIYEEWNPSYWLPLSGIPAAPEASEG